MKVIGMDKRGVYCIRCLVNNKVYVGSVGSKKNKKRTFAKRWSEHRKNLIKGIHCNRHLQAAWDKYGEPNFVFEPQRECLPEECLVLEQVYLDFYDAADGRYGYNNSPTARSNRGSKLSDEFKAKVSASIKKRWQDPEYKTKMKAIMAAARVKHPPKGHKQSESTRKKISEKISKIMLGNTHFKGRRHADVAREKIAAAARAQWQESHRELVSIKNQEAAKKQWDDPVYRVKHKAAMAAWHAKRKELLFV